jgi:spermidine/putrescine-binding protein
VIDDWYQQNNIALDVKYISNENLVNFMKSPGSEKWDASSVNQGDAEYLFANKVSSPITVDEVPALGTMLPFFKDGTFWKVSDGVYNSVPWTWGPIGINTRPEKVPADALKSWQGLLDPKWKGRIGTYDDALNMISAASVATGNDPGKLTLDQLNGPVKDFLVKLKPQLKVLSTSIGDQVNLLVSGDVDIEILGLTWFLPQAAGQGVTIDFRIPDEGSYGFVDAVFITPWAPDRANAVAYANALISGDSAVTMQNSVSQLSTNPDINAKLKPEVRSLYPEDLAAYSGTTLKWNKSWYDANGPYASIDAWRKVWDDVKALG